MRSRRILLTLSLGLAIAVLGCNKPPDNSASNAAPASSDAGGSAPAANAPNAAAPTEPEKRAEKREPLVVPAGTSLTVRLGSALGSKLSQAGQTFTGTIAADVMVGEAVAIPKDASVSGTVTDAKPLGKFAGGASLAIRLDSISLHGKDVQVQTALKSFSQKGKGKRTAVVAGGGAALGAIIGGIAGGGKGAAIGALAGGGAGTGGAALTGNKEIVLPAESAVSFELSQPVEIRR